MQVSCGGKRKISKRTVKQFAAQLEKISYISDLVELLEVVVFAHKVSPEEEFGGEDEMLEGMLKDIRRACEEIINGES